MRFELIKIDLPNNISAVHIHPVKGAIRDFIITRTLGQARNISLVSSYVHLVERSSADEAVGLASKA